ncbi:hypothetical protein [Helicobacter pullorum]|uniref:hypothetical protein n=1 Tax=Helicobacter pullorum TaxID=35818 RepID=UPI001247627A|nr:hypothetical protein [Helicobacter pullorum]KAB0574549.1 hypothetical protein F7P74_06335 [Helicobacter pullorum NCTC 12824]
MIRNAGGVSPFVNVFAFSCEANVYVTPTTPNSKVKISVLDSTDKELYIVADRELLFLGGIYLNANQKLKVEINGGGSVFVSYLEENTSLIGGVSVTKQSYIGDNQTTEFALPSGVDTQDKALINVFVEGMKCEDYSLQDSKVVFGIAPFSNSDIEILAIIPQGV